MSTVLQFRRGSTSATSTFTGQPGELTVDNTLWTVVVQDGTTAGGHPLSKVGHTHVETDITNLSYATVQLAGTSETQREYLNFSSYFSATDDSINNRTTISLANNNTSGSGTYGSATQVPQVHIDATGVITSVTAVTITGVVPGGTASGDLGGNYPGPTVATVGGKTSAAIATTVNTVTAATNANTASTLVYRDPSGNFSAGVITASLTGNVTGNCSGTAASFTGNLSGDVSSIGMTTTIASVNSNVGSFGSATQTPHITVNAKGQITACTLVTVSGVSPAGGAGGDLSGSFPDPSVATVGGVGASAIASGASAANSASTTAVSNVIALRDANGGCAFTRLQETINVASFSSTTTFDLSLGGVQQTTATSAFTVAPTNLGIGQFVVFDIINGTGGGGSNYGITWPSNVYGGGTNIGTTGGGHNTQLFYSDGSNLYSLGTIRTV
jgi:hypothetical protein